MEKVFSFVFCAMLGAGTLWASDFRMDTVIAPGLTITANDSCYRISYKLPPFHEEIVETEHGYFSTIVFDDDDDFFELGDNGRPALPFKNILLQLPDNAMEVDLHVVSEPNHYNELGLRFPYLPAQHSIKSEAVFSFDEEFYDKTDRCGFSLNEILVSDIFHCLGTTGIAVNFSPTTYYPSANKVAVPDEIIIEVRCTGLSALRDIYGWYDPYDFKWRPFDDDYRPLQGYNHGRLAIFTLPEYEEALDEYVEYKESKGFTVSVYASNDYTNAAELRSSIRSLYNDKENRPRYVLIVGDVNQIPHSKGVTGNVNNPPTDLYYACLENASIAAEPNPIPEVLLGRWPARNEADIKNMTDKTIAFEKETAACRGLCKKRCSLFSGTDDKLWMRDWFFRDIRYIGKRMTDLGYNSYLYDGRSVSASAAPAIVNDVMERSNWILVYSGHGSSDDLSNPWQNVFSNDGIVNISSSPVCPISFFFACNVNSNPGPYPGPYPYPDPNIYGAFGMNWVRSYSDKGGVAALASTTNTRTDKDREFSMAIFNSMKKKDNSPYLGGLILDGQTSYYGLERIMKPDKRRQIERYVLIGDPSLMVYGFYRNGIPYQQTPGYTDSETDDCQKEILITPTVANQYTLISVGDNVCADILVYNQSGVLVSILHNVCGETQITTSDFTEGCYLVAVSVDGRIISREKIFVKH